MKVSVKFMFADNPSLKESITFELPEGASLDDLVRKCAENERVKVDYENLKSSSALVNKVLGRLNTVLHDGDQVLIMRPLGGG